MTLWPPNHKPTQKERDAALDLLNEKIQEAERKMLLVLGDRVRPWRLEIEPDFYLAFEELDSGWHLTWSRGLLTSAPGSKRAVAAQHIAALLQGIQDLEREEAKDIEDAHDALDAFNE